MSKKFGAILLSALVCCLAISGTASAQNTDDPIWSGLWAGANFDFSSFDTTSNTGNSSSGSGTPSNTPASASAGYVALGDSVAAGIGLPDGNGQCQRSASAYPHRVARALNIEINHIACSGATAGDLVTKQAVSGPNITAQLDTAFANGTPSLITLTAGANDVHWNDYFLWKCYNYKCGTTFDTTLSEGYLIALEAKLRYAFSEISARSSNNTPKVLMTGYYQPLSQQCANLQTRVTSKEITWLNGRVALLNQTLASVAGSYSFVEFVPIDFSGHDICSSDPWVQGVNDAAPFHPTAEGQRMIARAVVGAYRD